MEKRRLSFWEVWNLSFGFLGIQMGFALQSANASRILQIFGADVEELSWFWIVAPLMGLIVQPIVGHYSDKTWTRMGRRKPFFLTGAFDFSCRTDRHAQRRSAHRHLPCPVDRSRHAHGHGRSLQHCHGTLSCLGGGYDASRSTNAWVQHSNGAYWNRCGSRIMDAIHPYQLVWRIQRNGSRPGTAQPYSVLCHRCRNIGG